MDTTLLKQHCYFVNIKERSRGKGRAERIAQRRFDKYGCAATVRFRCAIRRRGVLWHSGPKNAPLFCAYTWSLFAEGVQNFILLLNLADYFRVRFYVAAFLKKKHRNLTAASSLSLLRAHLDRGWSMTLNSALPFVLFALALIGVSRADNQQAQQSSVNAAICLLAVRSRSLPEGRSNLQARYTDLACCQRLYLIRSNAVDSTIS